MTRFSPEGQKATETPVLDLRMADDQFQIAEMLEEHARSLEDASVEAEHANGNPKEAKMLLRIVKILLDGAEKLKKIEQVG